MEVLGAKVTERRRPSSDLGRGQRGLKPCAREQTVPREKRSAQDSRRGRGGESEEAGSGQQGWGGGV